jgi:hypothetical protein
MAYLLDTSILVRLANANDPQRGLVFSSLAILHRRGEQLWIAPQSLLELWNVTSRPAIANGLGLPVKEVADLVSYFETDFKLAVETPELLERVKSIAVIRRHWQADLRRASGRNLSSSPNSRHSDLQWAPFQPVLVVAAGPEGRRSSFRCRFDMMEHKIAFSDRAV